MTDEIRRKPVIYTAAEITVMVVKFQAIIKPEVKYFRAGQLNVPYRPDTGPVVDDEWNGTR
jgi:hypothetical protein